LRTGCTRRTAPAVAGIHFVTFYRWLERARASRDAKRRPNRYTRLLDRIERAEAECMFECLARIMTSADNWQASAWLLERLSPDDWGPRARWRKPDLVPEVIYIREQVK
jgi:hypothetical protein